MTSALPRQMLLLPAIAAGAVVFGAMLGRQPLVAVALVGVVGVGVLAFVAPAGHLGLLVFMTLIFPFSIQNQFAGAGSAGLVFSDVLVMTGLFRAAVVLAQQRLEARQIVGIVLCVAFLSLAFVQFVRGAFFLGYGLAEPGNDFRALYHYGTLLMALPLVLDPSQHRRLLRALLVVGVLLGLWGLLQWSGNIPYSESGDFGVREGVRLTSDGKGQLQGGLYGFPVAVALAFAALLIGEIESLAMRLLLVAVIALNGVCVILTFERTFIAITLLACGIIVLRARGSQRTRAILLAPIAAVCILAPLAAVAPDSLSTVRERMLSIGQYGSDDSVRYRVRESQQAIEEIRERPWAGSGLGAAIWWGRPANGVLPSLNWFIHNGYLWHAWKLGIPGALLLVGALVAAGLQPGRARGTPLFAGLVIAAQATLIALLVTSVTFPAITARPITPVLGILLALTLAPRVPRRTPRPAGADA